MMYSEFSTLCSLHGVDAPSENEFSEVIEPVFNFHPAFDGVNSEENCAKLYATCGIGVFANMMPEAETFEKMETALREKADRMEAAFNEYTRLNDEFQKARKEMREDRETIRAMWRWI